MKIIRFAASLYLIAMISFILGAYVTYSKNWPYSLIEEISNFIEGGEAETTTIAEKILSDLNVVPSRFVRKFSTTTNLQDFTEVESLEINKRRARPIIYSNGKALPGFRAIAANFDLVDSFVAVVLLNERGELVHTWKIPREYYGDAPTSKGNKEFLYGFEILRDGSLIVAVHNAEVLLKFGYCGDLIWQTKGFYHHSLVIDGNGYFWTWGTPQTIGDPELIKARDHIEVLQKIDVETGQIVESVSLVDVMKENMDNMDIFMSHTVEDAITPDGWLTEDLWHPNDADPLPAALRESFGEFEVGDLLVSLRRPSLVFVLDPITRRVKWWRQGQAADQHDPDWQANGQITIFSNRKASDHSDIISLDPRTFQSKVLVDGRDHFFYSGSSGDHQVLPDGSIQITSSNQGRVFEVNADGEIVFEFINRYDDDSALYIGTAKYVAYDDLEIAEKCH